MKLPTNILPSFTSILTVLFNKLDKKSLGGNSFTIINKSKY